MQNIPQLKQDAPLLGFVENLFVCSNVAHWSKELPALKAEHDELPGVLPWGGPEKAPQLLAHDRHQSVNPVAAERADECGPRSLCAQGEDSLILHCTRLEKREQFLQPIQKTRMGTSGIAVRPKSGHLNSSEIDWQFSGAILMWRRAGCSIPLISCKIYRDCIAAAGHGEAIRNDGQPES